MNHDGGKVDGPIVVPEKTQALLDEEETELRALWEQLLSVLGHPKFDLMLAWIEEGIEHERQLKGLERRPSHVGVYDSARRRRGQRHGRERGCWVYVPAEELERAGTNPNAAPPYYRLWTGVRGTIIVRLYDES